MLMDNHAFHLEPREITDPNKDVKNKDIKNLEGLTTITLDHQLHQHDRE